MGKFKLNWTNVVAKWPGSCHDSFIFRTSALGRSLEEGPHSFDDGILLGDSGFALRPFLMTPYLNPVGRHQRRFNTAHRRSRGLLERVIRILKRRFHILHSEIRCNSVNCCYYFKNVLKKLIIYDVSLHAQWHEVPQR